MSGSVRNYIWNINPILDDHRLTVYVINLRCSRYHSWLGSYHSRLSHDDRLSLNNCWLGNHHLSWPEDVDGGVDSMEDSIENRDRVVLSIHLPEHCYCHDECEESFHF